MNKLWEYFEGFLPTTVADNIYAEMLKMSWLIHPDDSRGYGDGAYAKYFGNSFQSGRGGARKGEHPEIPSGWRKLADKIADKVNCPVNSRASAQSCPRDVENWRASREA